MHTRLQITFRKTFLRCEKVFQLNLYKEDSFSDIFASKKAFYSVLLLLATLAHTNGDDEHDKKLTDVVIINSNWMLCC